MLLAPHFLTGAAIASTIKIPFLAAVLALLSHFLLDLIPHRDLVGENHLSSENLLLRLIDLFATLFLFLVFVPSDLRGYAFWLGLTASLPDGLALWQLVTGSRRGFLASWQRFHVDFLQGYFKNRIDWFWGLLTQALVLIIALLWLAR